MSVLVGPPVPDAIGRMCGLTCSTHEPSLFGDEASDEGRVLNILLAHPTLGFGFRIPISEPNLCLLVPFLGLFQGNDDLG